MKTKIFFFYLYFLCFLCLGKGSLALAQDANSLTTALKDFSGLNDGQKSMILSSVGMPDVSTFSWAKTIAYVLFGGIGFVTFVYGKKQENLKALLIGIALMAYPYFLASTFWLYAAGVGLCFLLYVWRD